MSTYIQTLGDSTIDNLFWMFTLGQYTQEAAKKLCVEGQLRERGYDVVSHAYDGFTTTSLLEGDSVGRVLPDYPEKAPYMLAKTGKSTFVHPLEDLQKSISKAPDATHYVVLSVGGNDFRENLASPWRLISDISQIQRRYLQVLDKVQNLEGRNIRPIIVLQYRTDANNDPYKIYTSLGILGAIAVAIHVLCFALLTAPLWVVAGKVSLFAGGLITLIGAVSLYGSTRIVPLSVTKNVLLCGKIGMSMIDAMLQSFYQPILEKARQYRIPILDLSNTFNPYDSLYECGIEPNEKGGRLIADGIDHIVTNHDFSGESVLYSKAHGKSNFMGTGNQNPSSWRVNSPSKL